MTTELIHEKGGDTLRYAGFDFVSGLYKLRIPAGTKSWQVGMQTGNLPVPCSVLMSLDTAPDAARAQPVGSDYRTVLQRLWAGETLRSDSPANSGTLSVSQADQFSDWRADRERWLFVQFDFGTYKCLAWQSHVTVIASAPTDDAALLERTRQYVNASGYTDAIRAFGGFGPGEDAALVTKATACGLVKALTDMVRMVEQGGK